MEYPNTLHGRGAATAKEAHIARSTFGFLDWRLREPPVVCTGLGGSAWGRPAASVPHLRGSLTPPYGERRMAAMNGRRFLMFAPCWQWDSSVR